MRNTILCLTLALLPAAASATFIESPLISCSSSQVRDAGYSFAVSLGADNRFQGQLSQSTYGGPKPLGTEEVIIEPKYRNGTCGLEIRQRFDRDGNALVITMMPTGPGEYRGLMNLRLGGQPIADFMRPQSCHVDQRTYNQICRPRFGGEVYQQNNTAR